MDEIKSRMEEAYNEVINRQSRASEKDKLAQKQIAEAVNFIGVEDGVPGWMNAPYYQSYKLADEKFGLHHLLLENGNLCVLFTPNEFAGLGEDFRMTVAVCNNEGSLKKRTSAVQNALLAGLETFASRNKGRLYKLNDALHPYSTECWVKPETMEDIDKLCNDLEETFECIKALDKKNSLAKDNGK